MVGIGGCHFAGFIGFKSFKVNAVGHRLTGFDAGIAAVLIGINGQEDKAGFLSERSYFAGSADALDNAIAAQKQGFFVELIGDIARNMFGPEGIGHRRHTVAIHGQGTALYLFDQEGANGKMEVVFLSYKIINYGSFSGPEGACDADDFHKIRYSRIQRFEDSKIRRFEDSKIQRFKDSRIQGIHPARAGQGIL